MNSLTKTCNFKQESFVFNFLLINPNKNCHENVTIIFPHQEDFFINVTRSYIINFPHHKRNTMRSILIFPKPQKKYHEIHINFSQTTKEIPWDHINFFHTTKEMPFDHTNYFHTWQKRQSLNSYPTTLTFYSKFIEFWPFWNPTPNHLGFQNAKNFWKF
jgi:hypothetical protein